MKKPYLPLLLLCLLPLVGGCASLLDRTDSVNPATGETNSFFSVKPEVLGWLSGAKEVNSAVNPTPSAPIINLALTGISLFLAAYAKRQNSKAKLLEPMIEGVEASGSDAAKQAIRKAAMRSGLGDRLHREVKAITALLLLAFLTPVAWGQTNFGTITVSNGLTWDHGGETNLSGFRLYVAPVGVTNLAAFVLVDEVQSNGWWGDRTRQLHGPMWPYATAVATNMALTLHSYSEALDEWVAVGDTKPELPAVITEGWAFHLKREFQCGCHLTSSILSRFFSAAIDSRSASFDRVAKYWRWRRRTVRAASIVRSRSSMWLRTTPAGS